MTVVTLRARNGGAGVSGDSLLPARFASLSESEIAKAPLQVGRAIVALGELFSIRVEPGGTGDGAAELRVETGALRIDGLAKGMSSGRLVIEGDAGDDLGAGLEGGEITLHGSCGDGCGAGMTGGILRVKGSVGERVGGAVTGDPRGMSGGVILVEGTAGDEAGAAMRRGLVAIGGSAGARAGFHAIAGTVVVFGDVGEAPAMGTKRGSVVVFGRAKLLPGFRYACDFAPEFMRLVLRYLSGPLAFAFPERYHAATFRRFAGDFTQLGKGEILLWKER